MQSNTLLRLRALAAKKVHVGSVPDMRAYEVKEVEIAGGPTGGVGGGRKGGGGGAEEEGGARRVRLSVSSVLSAKAWLQGLKVVFVDGFKASPGRGERGRRRGERG